MTDYVRFRLLNTTSEDIVVDAASRLSKLSD
jgi:hypothetical protein